EEEWLVLVFADELHRCFGVLLGQPILVRTLERIDHLLIPEQREWWFALRGRDLRNAVPVAVHIVRVWQTAVVVESVPRRQERRLISQMPFANAHGRVAALFEQFGQSAFLRTDAGRRGGAENVWERDSLGITPRHELGTRGCADGTRVKAGQLHP